MQLINTVDPTIHLAIELSASSWLIAARVPGSEKPHLHRIDGGNTAALLALISSLRARVARRLDAAIGVICCFEAGRDGFWLHRLLTAHGITNYVLEPTSILVNRRARRANDTPVEVWFQMLWGRAEQILRQPESSDGATPCN